ADDRDELAALDLQVDAAQHLGGRRTAREGDADGFDGQVRLGHGDVPSQLAAAPRETSRPARATVRSRAKPTRPIQTRATTMSEMRDELYWSQMKNPTPTPPSSISEATMASQLMPMPMRRPVKM